jgi:pre-mRNA cleavage complex 2 protein Pcf11
MEWIRHVEFDPSTTSATATETAKVEKKSAKDSSVRAPAGMTKNTCNICFEEMKSSYSEELQDWIFSNAQVHNGRIVHATCLEEMTRGQGGAAGGAGSVTSSLAAALASVGGVGRRERSATPDSLLGKRKAEQILVGGGARVKME